MKRVLILGVASVQADAIGLLNESGYETYACAMAKDGPGADLAHHFDIINIMDLPKVIDHIRKNHIDAVYSVGSDLAMPAACRISEALSLPHFVSSKVAETCNNKEKMRESLGKDFTGNIPYQVIDNIGTKPQIAAPYIMKPADSQGQRGIVLVSSTREFQDNFEMVKKYSRSGKVIIEKFIGGPEFSVNAYLVENKIEFIVVSDRVTWPQYTGLIRRHIVPSNLLSGDSIKSVQDVVEKACRRIGINQGPAYFQIKMEAEKPYIIEMTPRLDGCHMWKLLKYYTGINLLKLTFEHLLNGDLSELNKESNATHGYELEFFCQEPDSVMGDFEYQIPEDSLEHHFYYQTGEQVRRINGQYEKVGYVIKNLERNKI